MALTKEERNVIKEKLPHGAQAEIAKETGYSRMAVNFYLNAKRDNLAIEEAVVRKYCEVMQKEKDLRKKINEFQ